MSNEGSEDIRSYLDAKPLTESEVDALVLNAKHGIVVGALYFNLLRMAVDRIAARKPKATREQVYAVIDTERNYQARVWNRDTTTTEGVHENLSDWLMYMRRYIGKAEELLSSKPEPEATERALHELRKVTALGVAAMEQIGAPARLNGAGLPFQEGDNL